MPETSDSKVINDSADFTPMPQPGHVTEADLRRLDAVPFEFADIRALAQRILKRAQEQGMAKIEAARKQVAAMEKAAADKAHKEAFPKGEQAGFAKGEQAGMAAAEKKIAAAVTAEKESLRQNAQPVTGVLEQLAAVMNENRQQLLTQAEGDLLLLSLDIAKRLVGHELSVDAEAVRPLATECIGLVTDRTGITVRVNPEDYRVMNEIMPELKTIFPDLGPVRIESDAAVERGGLMAATREAEVDMRLATRLAAFEEAILGFSGDDAVAPWSRIPAEAIEAAKREREQSAYSLDAFGAGEAEEPAEAAAPAAPAVPTESAIDPAGEAVHEAEPEAADASPEPAAIDPAGADLEIASASVSAPAAEADDLAELAALADAAAEAEAGEAIPEAPAEADAELAALAEAAALAAELPADPAAAPPAATAVRE